MKILTNRAKQACPFNYPTQWQTIQSVKNFRRYFMGRVGYILTNGSYYSINYRLVRVRNGLELAKVVRARHSVKLKLSRNPATRTH